MPKITKEHVDARRRQVMTAAHHCFARHGFHETTMQEIADEAGLSAGALYQYFESKDALIEALADRGREIRREALGGLQRGGGAQALAQVVGGLLRPLADATPETEAALRLDIRLWGEALDQPGIRQLFLDQSATLKRPIADFLRAERKAGRIRRDVDPEGVADAVFALLVGLELQTALDSRFDVNRYTKTLNMLLGLMATPDRGP